jgi:hypothetical protein
VSGIEKACVGECVCVCSRYGANLTTSRLSIATRREMKKWKQPSRAGDGNDDRRETSL